MPRIEVVTELETISCYRGDCGILFAVPEHWLTTKRRDHSDLTCPNGHSQAFLKQSREELLKEELKRTQESRDYYQKRNLSLEERQDTLKRQVAAQKGVATRLRNKAIAGECGFCHVRFADVAQHVQAEHTGEAAEEEVESDG